MGELYNYNIVMIGEARKCMGLRVGQPRLFFLRLPPFCSKSGGLFRLVVGDDEFGLACTKGDFRDAFEGDGDFVVDGGG